MINVLPYNPEWPLQFEKEAAFLRHALGKHCLAIHHIGSTSVEGLSAKPDIDIMCVVDQLSHSVKLQDYTFKGEVNIPLRFFLSKNTAFSKVNLHVVEKDHGFIPLNLCFRDYLRTNKEARLEYGALKIKLIKDPMSHEKSKGGLPNYTLGKDHFIKNLLDKAGFDGISLNFCIHDREWETYHHLCGKYISFEDGHYHFVLYKGTRIVAAAHVKFSGEKDATLKEVYREKAYQAQMLTLLGKWITSQGRTFTQ